MKKAISIILQTILLFIVYALASFFPPFHVTHMLVNTPTETRTFVWDGILCMLIVYIVILLIEAARKRLPTSALGSTIALVLAATLGLVAKFGFITVMR